MAKTKKTDVLVPTAAAGETRQRAAEGDEIEVGQWYWATDTKENYEYDDDEENEDAEPIVKETPRRRLACVIHVGSNFAKLEGVERWTWRIHFDQFDKICERELNPESYIKGKVDDHQHRANVLMDKVKQLTATLGITRKALTEGDEGSTALVVAHGVKDVKAHKKALIKAKEKTLPELFNRIREEHEAMARWMKADLIPLGAQTKALKKTTEAIEDRIFTVELYAGLTEDVELIRKGKPAENSEKIRLLQRRHYMDEECLIDYTAGGMEFKDIHAFERWLLRKSERRERIFPFPRCVVAFRVRREDKEREVTLSNFISIMKLEDADKATFLYIRNGEQFYRLQTAIDFGAQLFPDRHHDTALGEGGEGPLYANTQWSRIEDVITEGDYLARQQENAEKRKEHDAKVRAWKKLSKEERKSGFEPWWHAPHDLDRYEPCTPESTYYDDIMRYLAREAMKHNRVATVLQGLLDRSPVFKPHPPWQLWTMEGFTLALDLIYDSSRALTDGAAPDFAAFRQQLNESLKMGSMTVGQEHLWAVKEADKKYEQDCDNWRIRDAHHWKTHYPYGNPGPGHIAEVVRFISRSRKCSYEWQRARQNAKWVNDPNSTTHMMRDPSTLTTRFACLAGQVMNVSAYTPGDYKQFYNDPRTRAEYLQWAPWMLAAENWHHEQAKEKKAGKKEEEKQAQRAAEEAVFGKGG